MPSARQLVASRRDLFDPGAVRTRYPWLVERDQDCIVSPDADGLLCGLFMSHHLGWKVRGFYDGKVLVCDHKVRARDCIFLDMEIYRHGVRSAGQHMLLYNKRHLPSNWSNFDGCASINNYRGYDANTEFALKYPFGTIHFLVAAVDGALPVTLPDTAVAPLLFVDGTYHNLFRYTENSLDWLRYLGFSHADNPLRRLFMEDQHTIHELMSLMDRFWEARDEFSVPGQRGDRIAITRRGGAGEPQNLVIANGDHYDFDPAAKNRGERFLELLAQATGWRYEHGSWTWGSWRLAVFEKGDMKNVTIPKFHAIMADNPLSFAITAGRQIEYTTDHHGLFEAI